MKTKQTTQYICEICEGVYYNKHDAEICESRSISEEKGVHVGDLVRVTGGDGMGEKSRVKSIFIGQKDAHSGRYWHTVVLDVDLVESYGSRILTFDQYETLT